MFPGLSRMRGPSNNNNSSWKYDITFAYCALFSYVWFFLVVRLCNDSQYVQTHSITQHENFRASARCTLCSYAIVGGREEKNRELWRDETLMRVTMYQPTSMFIRVNTRHRHSHRIVVVINFYFNISIQQLCTGCFKWIWGRKSCIIHTYTSACDLTSSQTAYITTTINHYHDIYKHMEDTAQAIRIQHVRWTSCIVRDAKSAPTLLQGTHPLAYSFCLCPGFWYRILVPHCLPFVSCACGGYHITLFYLSLSVIHEYYKFVIAMICFIFSRLQEHKLPLKNT